MKAHILFDLVSEGKKPFVVLTGELWRHSFGVKGMIAQVVSAKVGEFNRVKLVGFDYNKHRDRNLALWERDSHIGPALVACCFTDPNDIYEEAWFAPNVEVNAELQGSNTLLEEYASSGYSGSYVEWLEARVKGLVESRELPLLDKCQ